MMDIQKGKCEPSVLQINTRQIAVPIVFALLDLVEDTVPPFVHLSPEPAHKSAKRRAMKTSSSLPSEAS